MRLKYGYRGFFISITDERGEIKKKFWDEKGDFPRCYSENKFPQGKFDGINIPFLSRGLLARRKDVLWCYKSTKVSFFCTKMYANKAAFPKKGARETWYNGSVRRYLQKAAAP